MHNKEMRNEEIRKLTIAAIRVAEGFRGGEVLRNKIQEKALDIFVKSNPEMGATLLKDIKLLKQFINLARDLRLTKPINCEVLIREYNKVYELILDNVDFMSVGGDNSSNEIISVAPKKVIRKKRINDKRKDDKVEFSLTERQRKILGLFRNKNELRLKDIGKSFLNVTLRTLRNDLRKLVGSGKLKHGGAGAGSVYKIKSLIQ